MSEDASRNVTPESLKEGLESIFSAILGERDQRGEARLAERVDDPEIVSALAALRDYNYGRFSFQHIQPFNELTEAMIRQALGDNSRLVFLIKHQDFVAMHLQRLFQDLEGNACCADKERTVMKALIRFFHTGKEIKFNYEGEYTYHLPKFILREHQDIIDYFEALHALYYGQLKPIMEQSLKVRQTVTVARANEKS